MADASKDPDQSMEDILQSIKRIIADETEPSPTMPGSDVLELTELLAEDAAPPVPAAVAPPAPPAQSPQDDIDALFNTPAPAFEPEPAPVVAAPAPIPAAPAPAPAPTVAAPAPADDGDHLMSDATLSASIAALKALSHNPSPLAPHASPVFRSGSTVEDLVIEALKPMLKEWLDGNLPSMVKALVEKEIRRLSA